MTEVEAFMASTMPRLTEADTALRREDGEWKVVHRHGDPVPDSAAVHDLLGPISTTSGPLEDGSEGASGGP